MTGTLTKIKSTNENLRTPSVDGEFDSLPEVGQMFQMTGESLALAGRGFRLVQTSLVVSADKMRDELYEFKTYNSYYRLTINKI